MKEKKDFTIIKEMFETVSVVRDFHTKDLSRILMLIKESKKILLTWEGSSRMFPAKNVIYNTLKHSSELFLITEWAIQSSELNLKDYVIFGASNSWRTKEVIELFKNNKSSKKVSLTTYESTPLGMLADEEHILHCGKENAVAATKSVIEQGLFYQFLISEYFWNTITKDMLKELSLKIEVVLKQEIEGKIIEKLSNAPTIYFAWRNNGVAEEITLKTNEITRKKSDYLEGTYLVHWIEEVMDKKDVVVLINPFKEEEQKIKEVLVDGVGMSVYSISSKDSIFPTIKIPSMPWFDWYIELMAWLQLLVWVWLHLWIDLDTTIRARKVWNETLI